MKAVTFFLFINIIFICFIKAEVSPKIHGADIYGAKPGTPFLYKIPTTGKTPIIYNILNLPKGLKVDHNTGIITGSISDTGTYPTSIIAKNDIGADTLNFEIIIGDKISLTPAMGWNSWNVFGLRVTDKDIRDAADRMVSSGLINHGWSYINIDDGWESPKRNKDGEISSNNKFPDMVALSDYIHSKGLKFGIYSSPGPKTCGGYLGSYKHEEQDIKTYEKWGVDYLKYDWCSYTRVSGLVDIYIEKKAMKPYEYMGEFIRNSKRAIVYSICQYGLGNVKKWGKLVGGNSWRTTGDIVDTWRSVSKILRKQNKWASSSSLGHYNDPDMLVLGQVGWNNDSRKCRLTENEQRLHFSMWSMFNSPLLLGCDLTKIDSFTMSLLTNDNVIALNQDRLGKQAELVKKYKNIQIWKKELADGSIGIAIVNLNRHQKKYIFNMNTITNKNYPTATDLWTNKPIEIINNHMDVTVPSHGVLLLKLK
jgi:hypothetical protein